VGHFCLRPFVYRDCANDRVRGSFADALGKSAGTQSLGKE
jgi:hypothetical protein